MATEPMKVYFLVVANTKANRDHPRWKDCTGNYMFWYVPGHEDVGPGWTSWQPTEDIKDADMWTRWEDAKKAADSVDTCDVKIITYKRE